MIIVLVGGYGSSWNELVTSLFVAQQRKIVEEVDVVVGLRQVGGKSRESQSTFHSVCLGNTTGICLLAVQETFFGSKPELCRVSNKYHLRTLLACDVMQSLRLFQDLGTIT